MEAAFAELNGTSFYYEITGEGKPVILIHAGIADGRMWDEQFYALARYYRVVRYDRRGFGKTAMVEGVFSHHDDLYRLLQFLNIPRATLIGCSQGGKTAVDFTLEHPEMVESLILVASALSGFSFDGPAPIQAKELEAADEAGDLDRVNELELQIWIDGPRRSPGEVDPQVREVVREMNRIALSAESLELGEEQPLEPAAVHRLDEIQVPTLVIVGDYDTPRTQATADYLATHIAGAQQVVMPGTAHLPNMEQPDLFNGYVLNFLDGQRG